MEYGLLNTIGVTAELSGIDPEHHWVWPKLHPQINMYIYYTEFIENLILLFIIYIKKNTNLNAKYT